MRSYYDKPAATPVRPPLTSDEYAPTPRLSWREKCELYPDDLLVRMSLELGETATHFLQWASRQYDRAVVYGKAAKQDYGDTMHHLNAVLDQDQRGKLDSTMPIDLDQS